MGNANRQKRTGSGLARGLFVVALLLLLALAILPWENGKAPEPAPLWEEIPGTSETEAAEADHTQGTTASEETGAEEESTPLYCRGLLSDADRALYDEILSGITSRQETTLSTLDRDTLSRVYESVLADHPEIFYVNGYAYTTYTSFGRARALTFLAKYTKTEEEQEEEASEIDAAVEKFLANVPRDGDDYDALLAAYTRLIETTQYDTAAVGEGQNITSVFLDHRSVCNGYAKALQLLCQKLGMETALVTGTADGGAHAWDLVRADGDWYYVDPTWGDALEEDGSGTGRINYDYLCVTGADLALTHEDGVSFALPDCTATKDNYYVREGAYFTSLNTDQLLNLVSKDLSSGADAVRLRCADDAVFAKMKGDLVDNSGIYQYLPDVTSLSYTVDETMHTLCFFLSQ